MIRGYLNILVLQSIEESPKTSYGIKEHIGSIWHKKPSSGSLFPAITKLSCNKLIKSENIENKKIFSITKKGINYLDNLIKEKEDDLIEHIVLLKSINQLNSKRDVNILQRLSQKLNNNAGKNIQLIDKQIQENHQTMKQVLSKELSKDEEKEFKEISKEFNKKMKEFNKKIKVK